jgi:hypothetical protein
VSTKIEVNMTDRQKSALNTTSALKYNFFSPTLLSFRRIQLTPIIIIKEIPYVRKDLWKSHEFHQIEMSVIITVIYTHRHNECAHNLAQQWTITHCM